MKLIAYLIITVSLTLGAISATTAYLPPTSLPDVNFQTSGGEPFVLNADAGQKRDDQGNALTGQAIAPNGSAVTPEVLAELRAGNVQRIRVKQFSFDNWTGKWLFVASVFGLLAGAFMVKVAQQSELASHAAHSKPDEGPVAALAEMRRIIDQLVAELPGLREGEACEVILHRLDEVQRHHAMAITDGRSRLVAKLGMGGYAEFMDEYSSGERMVNRAWSAAADGVEEEAVDCLQRAVGPLSEAASRLSA